MGINSPEQFMGMMSGFQAPCVVGAAAELDVYNALEKGPRTAAELAQHCQADLRAMTALLDALAALEVLVKEGERYRLAADVAPLLLDSSPRSFASMIRHQLNCLRSWGELARVTRKGVPAKRKASIRGARADRAAFLQAMNDLSGPMAPGLIEKLKPLSFLHLLDVGGASGTWTAAFLKAVPGATATLFDLPDAIPHAKRRMKANGMTSRVALVAGDFDTDDLPKGADYAWVSAIIHQNSREQNRALFRKVFAALNSGGRIVIRDVVMDPTRTQPRGGALFAINMLVNTPAGGTFTLAELDEDLRQAGFGPAKQLLADPFMNSVVEATKP